MKGTVVLTAYDEAYKPLGELTAPLMKEYAIANDYIFAASTTRNPSSPPLWWKLEQVYEWLALGYRVIWLDADQVVMNTGFKLEPEIAGLHISQDWGPDSMCISCFSAGAYMAHPEAFPIFAWCLDHEEEFRNSTFGDQDALRACYKREPNLYSLFRIYPRRFFNAVHPLISPDIVDPYQEGDWLCHLTMVPLERRIELFHLLRSNRS